MKKKIITVAAITILTVSSFVVGTKVQSRIDNNNSIPFTDIAEMSIDEYDYYQIEIGDIGNVDDNKNNISYDEIFKIVNDR